MNALNTGKAMSAFFTENPCGREPLAEECTLEKKLTQAFVMVQEVFTPLPNDVIKLDRKYYQKFINMAYPKLWKTTESQNS